MKKNRYLSFFRAKKIKFIFLIIILSCCVYFIRPFISFEDIEMLVPVKTVNIPNGLTVTGPSLSSIEVHARCRVSMINKISNLKVHYLIDLSEAVAGVNPIKIEQKKIPVPDNVSIKSINPSFLAVRIDNEIVRKLPVKVAVSGKSEPGFHISHTHAEPSSVILRGPEHILSSIDEVRTMPVDVSGFSESFEKKVSLDIHEELKADSIDKIVMASIHIEETIGSKKIGNISIEGINALYPYEIIPSVINIEIQGPVNILNNLNEKDDIRVFIDFKDLDPGIHVLRASIIIPVNTALVDAKPDKFTVRVVKNKVENHM